MSDMQTKLEKAAVMAGFKGPVRMELGRLFAEDHDGRWQEWNPVDDGDDALNLAVDTQILTLHHTRLHQHFINWREDGSEPREAMRLAIVDTVAELLEKKD